MASTDLKSKTLDSFAISYGFCEGPRHAKKLNSLLNHAGYLSKPLNEADIIIAHSAGCWLIPNNIKPRLVIYVGMPLSSNYKTLLSANRNSLREGVHHNARVKLNNAYHGLRQPIRQLKIVRNFKSAKPVFFPNSHAVFIANRHDTWPRSEKLQSYLNNHSWSFISLPGVHDDIWIHPERYVGIINYYARLLAKTNY